MKKLRTFRPCFEMLENKIVMNAGIAIQHVAPFSILTIPGNYSTNTVTFVQFLTKGGQSITETPSYITNTDIQVSVPPLITRSSSQPHPGFARVFLIQDFSGQVSESLVVPLIEINNLPVTGVPPGTVIAQFATEMKNSLSTSINQLAQSLTSTQNNMSSYQAISSLVEIENHYQNLLYEIQPLMNRTARFVRINSPGGQSTVLTLRSLSLSDRMLAAIVDPPNSILPQNVQDAVDGLFTNVADSINNASGLLSTYLPSAVATGVVLGTAVGGIPFATALVAGGGRVRRTFICRFDRYSRCDVIDHQKSSRNRVRRDRTITYFSSSRTIPR